MNSDYKFCRVQLIIFLISCLCFCSSASANNISTSSLKLTNQDTVNNFTLIEFDIAWDNSWRTSIGPKNWDAAWVFVKYRLQNQTSWNHATLNYIDGTGNGDGHTEPLNTNISSSNDNSSGGAYGVFIYGNSDFAQGNVNYTDVQLRWNYGVDGLDDNDSIEICVFAIEMVYVPQGSFYLGSGGTEFGAFYSHPTPTNPYQVTNENAIAIDSSVGSLNYTFGASAGDYAGPIPAGYPKGYNAFYCMKYEITQSQYVDFLNKLTNAQAAARVYINPSNRNGITGTPGNYSTTYPHVGRNYMSWPDLSAYLDWAALRPMSELEFEKAGRGTLYPIANEYAWGTSAIATSAYTLSNNGLTNEGIATNYSLIAGNASYVTTDGALNTCLRVGIFSANASNSGRVSAGATYYGIMELSGNLIERAVTAGTLTGRVFTGLNGDGNIDAAGLANVTNWPSSSTGSGAAFRGGNYNVTTNDLRLSDRRSSGATYNGRVNVYGGRGVRSVP